MVSVVNKKTIEICNLEVFLLEFYDCHDPLHKYGHFCPHTLQLGTRSHRLLYLACQTGAEGDHCYQKPNEKNYYH